MDNLAHGLAGAWIGEALHRGSRPLATEEYRIRRQLYVATSVFANNAPDLDLVLSPLLPAPLGYLLHHRGHTHTIGFALVQVLLVFAAALCVPRFRARLAANRSERFGVLLVALLGLGTHLALDALNSYGVHPFWPFDAKWYFGDLVFIIEPALWACFGIPALFLFETHWARAAVMSLIVFVPVAAALAGLLPMAALGAVLSLMAALAFFARTRGAGASLAAGLIAALVFLAAQAAGQRSAVRAIRADFAGAGDRELDLILAPLPSNPVCWNYIRVARDADGRSYTMSRGTASALTGLVPAERCPRFQVARDADGAPAPVFERGSIARLKNLARDDCWFDAWLRFARAPLIDGTRASDWRFATRGTDNFTALPLGPAARRECPGWIPEWEKPRADLFAE